MTQYRVQGAFFENNKPSGPAFTGFVEIDGVKTNIALWPKTSAKGHNYFQVSEDKKKEAPKSTNNSPFKPRAKSRPDLDLDDDVPF